MDELTKTDDPSLVFDGILAYCSDIETSRSGKHGDSTLQLCDQVLKQLKEDGCDMVRSLECSSNLRTKRHLADRRATQQQCLELTEESERQIETEQANLQQKWNDALITTVPQEIQELISSIRDISDNILKDQEQLINRLRHELDRFEGALQREIEQQTDDLGEMRRRMRTHLDTMRQTYRSELHNIDEALGEDYMALLNNHSGSFDQTLKDWSTSETKILHDLMDYSDLWHQDIEATEKYHYQETKQCGIKLTEDIQVTELELEKLKCNILLSNSILDYNCQVLKIRDEEATTRKHQLKRLINRSFDQYRRLRDEWETLLKSDHEAREKMLKEMEQLRQENVLLERKFSTMKNASLLKLESVCLSAEENIDNLLKQLSMIDEQIFAQVLEQPWDGLVRQIPSVFQTAPLAIAGAGVNDGQGVEDIVGYLEKDLRYLLADPDTLAESRSTKQIQDKLMKTLGLADDLEFQEFLDEMSQCAPQTLLKDVIEYIRRRVQPMDEYHMTTGCYLVSPACARHHFLSYKEAIPQARIDLWNMLTRGLIEYERILKDRLALAGELHKLQTIG